MNARRITAGLLVAAIAASALPPRAAADDAAPTGVVRLDAQEEASARAGETVGRVVPGLSADRARVLLRSLTVPGWGQATVGRKTSATVFALAEIGVWASFTAFRIQSQLRRDAYQRTARLSAGIDLDDRDEEYRRIVGSYLSSDEYNLLVVHRDAANIYLSDPEHPDYEGYRAYIAANSVGGTNAWSWDSEESLVRYQEQRKDAQRAGIRANSALAAAIINRLLSAVHAARAHGDPGRARNWELEVAPGRDADATAFTVGVRARF